PPTCYSRSDAVVLVCVVDLLWLHPSPTDALPISHAAFQPPPLEGRTVTRSVGLSSSTSLGRLLLNPPAQRKGPSGVRPLIDGPEDRKSTRLNSSHVKISYAVFCLKKQHILQLDHS